MCLRVVWILRDKKFRMYQMNFLLWFFSYEILQISVWDFLFILVQVSEYSLKFTQQSDVLI